jgi:transmembrane sensor
MDELIDRARRGEATPSELDELTAWRHASDENERHYRQTIHLLETGRALGAVRTDLARPAARSIVARAQRNRSSAIARWSPWAVAAAATIVAAIALRPRTTETASVPGWGATDVVTGAAELATVQLGDGSVVRLAPSSRLRVLPGRERAVRLEGRAFFAVQRMPTHPLLIHTAAGDARVLGTRFELAADTGQLHVRVVEGKVALTTSRGSVEVGAGQEAAVQNGAAARPTPVVAPNVAPWMGTFLAFQATPLGEAAREIERVYHTPVTIVDTLLARETITASFTDRPVLEVVNVVCSVLDAHCEIKDGHIRIDR